MCPSLFIGLCEQHTPSPTSSPTPPLTCPSPTPPPPPGCIPIGFLGPPVCDWFCSLPIGPDCIPRALLGGSCPTGTDYDPITDSCCYPGSGEVVDCDLFGRLGD